MDRALIDAVESLILNVDTTKAELAASPGELPKRLSLLEEKADAADDYRQIMNAMSKHVFGYYGQIQEQELEKYWSGRDDIVYAHGNMAYYGKRDVYNYYLGMTSALKEKGREIVKRVYDKDVPEDEGPGYKVMNMLLSPYVEIAADRKTARGIWMAYAYMTHLKDDGTPEPSLALSRYGAEFIKEDGQWKLWHRVDYMECGLEYPGLGMMGGPPPAGDKDGPGNAGGPPGGGSPNGVTHIQYAGQKTLKQRSGGGMAPYEAAYPEPRIPEPYETWKQEDSYIVVEHDGYKA